MYPQGSFEMAAQRDRDRHDAAARRRAARRDAAASAYVAASDGLVTCARLAAVLREVSAELGIRVGVLAGSDRPGAWGPGSHAYEAVWEKGRSAGSARVELRRASVADAELVVEVEAPKGRIASMRWPRGARLAMARAIVTAAASRTAAARPRVAHVWPQAPVSGRGSPDDAVPARR